MTPLDLHNLLCWVDDKMTWPDWVTEDQKKEVSDMVYETQDGCVHLTSLGELEIGYPETHGETT